MWLLSKFIVERGEFVVEGFGNFDERQAQDVGDGALDFEECFDARRVAFFEDGVHQGEHAVVEGEGFLEVALQGEMHHVGHFLWQGVGHDGDDAVGPEGEHGVGEGVVAGDDTEAIGALAKDFHDLMEVATGFLDAYDVGALVGEGEGGLGGEVDTGAAGDVVHDDGHGRHFGNVAVVLQEAALVGLVVVGGHREDAANALEGGVGDGVGDVKGVVATETQHDGAAAGDGLDDEALHCRTFRWGHGGGFGGGAEGHDIVDTRGDDVLDEGFKFGEVDGFLLAPERGDEGDAGAGKK